MVIDGIRRELEEVQETIEQGPLYPDVTAEEIRRHLAARYDFGSTQAWMRLSLM